MMHHSMAPADGLVNVEVNNISGRPHPKADSVIDRAQRGFFEMLVRRRRRVAA